MSDIIDCQLYIRGTRRPAADGAARELHSPHDNRVIAKVSQATPGDTDDAVRDAHTAFLEWKALSPYKREGIIRKATAHCRTNADAIGRLMALEQGKPFNQSRSEIIASCDTIDYYAAEAVRIEGIINPTEDPGYRSYVVYEPVGVCALITPWNYPVSLLSWKLGPALATGCSVVVKPTTVTPLSPTAFCEALTEGGLPAGLLNVIPGAGKIVGEALLRHPLVQKVAMTGSSDTGKRLMEVFAPSLKKISLELGGQCPAIVCADADLDLAAKIIAYKGFRNNGQSCSSINRVYADSTIHDALADKLKAIAEKMSIGDGLTDPAVDLGPMATADGVVTCEEHVADALQHGAAILTGGKRPEGAAYSKGHYYLPTILTGATHAMKVMREETFGPVVPFASFTAVADAVKMANDTTYGLVAYLFTRDTATTYRVSEALEAGTVCVNHGAVNTNYGPYAGWKDSGYGVELSRKAVFEYLKVKHIKIALN